MRRLRMYSCSYILLLQACHVLGEGFLGGQALDAVKEDSSVSR